MKAPIDVRPLTSEERTQLNIARRSAHAFRVRRAQMVLASAGGQSPRPIAQLVGCSVQTVRNVIHAFNTTGQDCLIKQANRPKKAQPTLDATNRARLQHILHQSPRTFGKPTGLWTLALAAQVCWEQGVSQRCVSDETIRRALKPSRHQLEASQTLDDQPRSALCPQKKWRDRFIRLARTHSSWVLGFVDEVWWSRLAQPRWHAWTETKPLRLLQKEPDKQDLEPNALACYGVWRADTQTMLLRFVDGRPVSGVTTQFLGWLTAQLVQEQKQALLVVWDNASWHISREVRTWIKTHNRRVKRDGGCRLVLCQLPTKSPWLNRIAPKWVHGKRAIAEPERKLTVEETRQRSCDYYHCALLAPLAQRVA